MDLYRLLFVAYGYRVGNSATIVRVAAGSLVRVLPRKPEETRSHVAEVVRFKDGEIRPTRVHMMWNVERDPARCCKVSVVDLIGEVK